MDRGKGSTVPSQKTDGGTGKRRVSVNEVSSVSRGYRERQFQLVGCGLPKNVG